MRSKSMSRARGLAVGSLTVLLVPVGMAHLAQNSVPVTHAGAVEQAISVETQLTLEDAKVNVAQEGGKEYYHFIDLKAVLAYDGQPINDEPIVFTADGVTICTRTTDTQAVTHGQGLATCNAKEPVESFSDVPSTFQATFAGDPPLEGSSAEGALTVEGDNTGVGNH